MTVESTSNPELDEVIAALYGGPLDEFVTRRDALAKKQRAAGRREDADAVKRLRKPARMAWALDVAVFDDRMVIERVAAAVAATLEAQSGIGDLRAAFAALRTAVRSLAESAARAAAERGHPVDHAALVPAVMAVIGVADAFDVLRAGRLVDIPPGGGLDFLSLAPPTAIARAASSEPVVQTAEAVTASREALQTAEIALAAARERSEAAERTLREAEAMLETAEQQLRGAEQAVRAKRVERDHARDEAKAASAQLRDAERVAHGARA